MPEILSQQEIDSLLAGLSAGKSPVEIISKQEEKEVVPYEFRRPSRVSKNQIRTIQTLHQNFAESLGYYLTSRLQTPVTIQVENVDQLFYSEYILSIEKPSVIFTLSAGEGRGEIIFEVGLELSFMLIEKLLGGSIETLEIGKRKIARALTQIEQNLIRSIVERSTSDLEKAWSIIDTFKFKIIKYESDPDIVQIAPSSEIVLVISFIVTLGDRNYRMSICYPVFVIEETLAKMTLQRFMSVRKYTSEEYTKYIAEKIKTTKVPVIVELGQSEITLADLINLNIGDVILLNTKVDSEVKIYIAGKLKLYGKPGVFGGKKAVKITKIATNEEG
ncbi:flagellar motor switch protein FliM [Candidatus Kryptobacter tengchongensis]|uniref:flagellar motor switch protein FliM n=1 Tax=Kryptobacter tengchongensis TaxID=1643429 RepID=UPI000707DC6B|nr:flagellar motor switch protein FliM [Candidatus Kryptobacter tengchongensis]CUS83987.1 flagellar motor switch protein FliM [Candidatus Kryptobacter tengchongensis]CUU04094.1 flagellar motor switch protein FliM [Candidatus Kryptobacter tengchongensis]